MTTFDAGIQVRSGADVMKMVLPLTSHPSWLHLLTSILREQLKKLTRQAPEKCEQCCKQQAPEQFGVLRIGVSCAGAGNWTGHVQPARSQRGARR